MLCGNWHMLGDFFQALSLFSSPNNKAGDPRGSGTIDRYWPRFVASKGGEHVRAWSSERRYFVLTSWLQTSPSPQPPLKVGTSEIVFPESSKEGWVCGHCSRMTTFTWIVRPQHFPSGGTTLSPGFKLKPPVEICRVKEYIIFNKIARIIFCPFSQAVLFSAKYKLFSFWCFHLQPQWVSAMIYWLWRRQWRG